MKRRPNYVALAIIILFVAYNFEGTLGRITEPFVFILVVVALAAGAYQLSRWLR